MSPILGIFASQGRVASTSYESIATVTVGAGGSSSISFTSIPSTYKHLQVRLIAAGTSLPAMYLRLNSDSGANYTRHRLQGNGTSALADGITATNQVSIYASPGLPAANTFGATIIDILDYENTNKNTTVRILAGVDNNGSGNIELTSSLWSNTTAVNNIYLAPSSGNFTQYSQLALYGIKG